MMPDWLMPSYKTVFLDVFPPAWLGAPSPPAWPPPSPPSTDTLRLFWSSNTSEGTLRRTWRSSRSCWTWTLQTGCGTCTSAPSPARPRSFWTCPVLDASSPPTQSSWTWTTRRLHKERSTAEAGRHLHHTRQPWKLRLYNCCIMCGLMLCCVWRWCCEF